jgi:hypothetical protein
VPTGTDPANTADSKGPSLLDFGIDSNRHGLPLQVLQPTVMLLKTKKSEKNGERLLGPTLELTWPLVTCIEPNTAAIGDVSSSYREIQHITNQFICRSIHPHPRERVGRFNT